MDLNIIEPEIFKTPDGQEYQINPLIVREVVKNEDNLIIQFVEAEKRMDLHRKELLTLINEEKKIKAKEITTKGKPKELTPKQKKAIEDEKEALNKKVQALNSDILDSTLKEFTPIAHKIIDECVHNLETDKPFPDKYRTTPVILSLSRAIITLTTDNEKVGGTPLESEAPPEQSLSGESEPESTS